MGSKFVVRDDRTSLLDGKALAVDQYFNAHLLNPARNKYSDALDKAYDNSLANGLPDISVSPSQGKFLAIQAQIVRAKNILELGTLGAYSSIWMATAGPDVKVTSVEVDPHHKKVAEENIAYAGLSERIEILLGPGIEILPKLVEEVKSGKRAEFDMVFIDADKENNLNYVNLALEMTRSGACFYVDNIVRHGKVANAELVGKDGGVTGSRQVIEGIGADDRLEAVAIQTVSEKQYDGFILAVKK